MRVKSIRYLRVLVGALGLVFFTAQPVSMPESVVRPSLK